MDGPPFTARTGSQTRGYVSTIRHFIAADAEEHGVESGHNDQREYGREAQLLFPKGSGNLIDERLRQVTQRRTRFGLDKDLYRHSGNQLDPVQE